MLKQNYLCSKIDQVLQVVKQFKVNKLMHTYGCRVICALIVRFFWIKMHDPISFKVAEHEVKQAVMSASKTDYFCEAYKAAGRQDHYPSGNKETEMV